MTNKEYRKTDAISRSELSTLLKSTPKHFKYAKEHPMEEDTPSLVFGRAAHKYILEKEEFFDEFAIAPKVDKRTKAGKEEYAAFVEANEGKEVISIEDYEVIQAMSAEIDSDPFARIFLQGIHEQSFFWTDEETGEECKCRPDCLTEVNGRKYIVDYKTTDSCEDGHFERSVKKYGYKFQAGMYREGVFQNLLDDYGFVFVAQEKKAPYAVRTYICSEAFIDEGYDQFRKAIGIYHQCRCSGNWYGYEGPLNEISELTEEE